MTDNTETAQTELLKIKSKTLTELTEVLGKIRVRGKIPVVLGWIKTEPLEILVQTAIDGVIGLIAEHRNDTSTTVETKETGCRKCKRNVQIYQQRKEDGRITNYCRVCAYDDDPLSREVIGITQQEIAERDKAMADTGA